MKKSTGKISIQKAIAAVMGTALLAGWIFTADRGIGSQEKKIYREAVEQQGLVDKLGFSGFRLEEYPVAMYDGKADYNDLARRPPCMADESFSNTGRESDSSRDGEGTGAERQ